MRSGSTRWCAPLSRATPVISIVEVPAPLIRAPILTRQSARSLTSGSRAALAISVEPCASAAAIIATWVPPTVTLGKSISAAVEAFGRLGDDVAGLDRDLGAELLQRHQQKIDRAGADRAAAGQRHARFAHARDQRRDDPEAGAHARHEFVGRGRIDDRSWRADARSGRRSPLRPPACRRPNSRRRDCRGCARAG